MDSISQINILSPPDSINVNPSNVQNCILTLGGIYSGAITLKHNVDNRIHSEIVHMFPGYSDGNNDPMNTQSSNDNSISSMQTNLSSDTTSMF